jgi:hypothetical protein
LQGRVPTILNRNLCFQILFLLNLQRELNALRNRVANGSSILEFNEDFCRLKVL